MCELQFNLQKMIDVKESAAGHGSYERSRLFNDNAILATINDDTVELKTSLSAGADPSVREGRSRRAPALAAQLSLSSQLEDTGTAALKFGCAAHCSCTNLIVQNYFCQRMF